MQYTLADGDRANITAMFAGGASWSALNANPETLRGWRVLRDTSSEILLGHGTGAALRLSRRGDRVTGAELLEGDEGRRVQAQHGFRPSDAAKARARKAFQAGRDLDEALDAFHAKSRRRMLDAQPGTVRVAYGWEGLVEVDVRDGRVDGHRWVTGADALDAYDAFDDAKVWAIRPWPKNPVPARTVDEARLYCAVNKADIDRTRWRRNLEVRARTPEGWVRFEFDVRDRDADGMGTGRSKCLDPADWVLFGKNVLKDLPAKPADTTPARRDHHAERLRLAVAGIAEALATIPSGEDVVPLGIYHTRMGEFSRMRNPDAFTRSALEAQRAELEVAREAWVALSAEAG